MNKYKKFTFILLSLLIGFISFHGIIWQFTKQVYPNDYIVGDLARMSYKFNLITSRKNNNTLPKTHIPFNNYKGEEIDLITIGDSFSNGGGGGLNRYYQDYISSMYNLKVLNILKFKQSQDYVDTLITLLDSGFLDKTKPKYIILESVQRNTYENIGFNKINYIDNLKYDNIISDIKNNKDIYNTKDKYNQNLTFINNLNYNVILYNCKFLIDGYGKQGKYYIEKLNKDLFTSKTKNELLFFQDDIRFLKYETKENLENLNEKLNLLANRLKDKNIKLYYMPVVDKYTLYRDKLLFKNKYPKSIFFEYLEGLNKDYYLINTKKILSEELNNNVIDLYYSDDTHWNYKASEAIINRLNFN